MQGHKRFQQKGGNGCNRPQPETFVRENVMRWLTRNRNIPHPLPPPPSSTSWRLLPSSLAVSRNDAMTDLRGWMDGLVDGWMDGWMNGWVGGRMDGRMVQIGIVAKLWDLRTFHCVQTFQPDNEGELPREKAPLSCFVHFKMPPARSNQEQVNRHMDVCFHLTILICIVKCVGHSLYSSSGSYKTKSNVPVLSAIFRQ